MTNVTMDAHRQLMARPADERFNSVAELSQELALRMGRCTEIDVERTSVVADGGRLYLNGDVGRAQLTDWSFGQVCGLCEPSGHPSYFKKLPPSCAEQVAGILNQTLPTRLYESGGRVLIENRGIERVARAVNSQNYERVWDFEITDIAKMAEDEGFSPREIEDVPMFKIQGGGASLYSGDRDTFLFLIADDMRTDINGDGDLLAPGLILFNSEVGAKSLGFMTFWYRFVCQNHMIWGSQDVFRQTKRHVGSVRDLLEDARHAILNLKQEAVGRDIEILRKAQEVILGRDTEEVIKELRKRGFSKKLSEKAVENAQEEFDSDFNSVYSIVQGLTAEARTIPYAADRTEAERDASALLDLATAA